MPLVAAEGFVRAVGGDNARALLPAMLQGEKAVVGEDGRVRMPVNGKNAALVSGFVQIVCCARLIISTAGRCARAGPPSPLFPEFASMFLSSSSALKGRTPSGVKISLLPVSQVRSTLSKQILQLFLGIQAKLDRARMRRGRIIFHHLGPWLLIRRQRAVGLRLHRGLGMIDQHLRAGNVRGRLCGKHFEIIEARLEDTRRADVHFGNARHAIEDILLGADGIDRVPRDDVAAAGKLGLPERKGLGSPGRLVGILGIVRIGSALLLRLAWTNKRQGAKNGQRGGRRKTLHETVRTMARVEPETIGMARAGFQSSLHENKFRWPRPSLLAYLEV